MAADETTDDEKPMGPAGMLIMGVILGGCGLAMAMNLLDGTSQWVDGPRTDHWLVTLLGKHTFTVLSCVVCLVIGVGGLVIGIADLVKRARGQDDEDAPSREGSITATCPTCAKTSRVKARAAGRRLRCPGCKTEFRAPAA